VEGATLTESPEARNPDGNLWELAPWRERERWEQLDHLTTQEEPDPPTRLHVHCFLLLRKTDVEAVKALWPYGQAYVNAMRVNDLSTFHRLAAYITKESREGSTGNGERAYVPSLGLIQPVKSGHWCNEYEGLTAPKEAEIIQSGAERNEIYGTSMEFIYYRMPRPIQQPKPYRSKGKLSQKGRKKP